MTLTGVALQVVKVQLIKFTHSRIGKTVTVGNTPNDEENLTKALTNITIPRSTAQQQDNSGANTTQVLDLLMKAEQRITIKGFLFNGTVSGDSSTTASGRKSDLKEIFLAGGTFSMTYEGSTFSANSDKLSIARIPTAHDSSGNSVVSDGEAEFSIQMTMVRGEDLGNAN